MDTVSDFAREQVKPLIHEEYDGKDLFLGDSGRTLETRVFKGLADLKRRTLITSDGTTILGADDKAGVAEIMTLAQRLMEGGRPMEGSASVLPRMRRLGQGLIILTWMALELTLPTQWTAGRRVKLNMRISMPQARHLR